MSAPLPAPGDRARVSTWVAVAPVDAFEVEHRGGGAARRPSGAARLEGSAFSGMIGRWWGELCSAYRERVAERVEAARR